MICRVIARFFATLEVLGAVVGDEVVLCSVHGPLLEGGVELSEGHGCGAGA